jgi:hypothetical protein
LDAAGTIDVGIIGVNGAAFGATEDPVLAGGGLESAAAEFSVDDGGNERAQKQEKISDDEFRGCHVDAAKKYRSYSVWGSGLFGFRLRLILPKNSDWLRFLITIKVVFDSVSKFFFGVDAFSSRAGRAWRNMGRCGSNALPEELARIIEFLGSCRAPTLRVRRWGVGGEGLPLKDEFSGNHFIGR